MLHLQRTVGNRGVAALVRAQTSAAAERPLQRAFDEPLRSKTVDWIYDELRKTNEKMPPKWKIAQLMNDPTTFYSTLSGVAAKLSLNPPASDLAPVDSTPPTETSSPTSEITAPEKSSDPVTPPSTVTTAEPTVKPPLRRPPPVQSGPPTESPSFTRPSLRKTVFPPKQTTTQTSPPPSRPVHSTAPTGTGMLTVQPLAGILNTPETGTKVFGSPPEYITVTFQSETFRLKAGQNYLNSDTSALYRTNKDEIKGSAAKLVKPPVGLNLPDDVRVVADGHHRLIWGAYHGEPVQAEIKKFGSLNPTDWEVLEYKGLPPGMAVEPITDIDQVKEDAYKAFVSTEPLFKKFGTEAKAFLEAFLKYRKLAATEEQSKTLLAHFASQASINPTPAYDAFITALGSASGTPEGAKYARHLLAVKDFLSGRKPAVIKGPAVTTGYFDTTYNIITLDPSKLSTPLEMLDTLTFEVQNARNRAALTAAKQKGGGHHTAAVEFDSDRKYIDALMAINEVTTLDALLPKLDVDVSRYTRVSYTELKKGGVPLPPTSELPVQSHRQALWWWKTQGWTESQRREKWGQAPHGEGLGSSEDIYKKS